MPPLSNGRHELFAQELAQGRTADAAYAEAGYKPNRGNAARLKADECIQARVAELVAAGAERAEVSVAGVLAELWSIGCADANDLVEFRRGACRYCWGKRFRYQETPAERERRERLYSRQLQEAGEGKDVGFAGEAPEVEPFDELGGPGYDARKAPHTACPECFGEGVVTPFLKDTRFLSEGARRLYAGIKVTKDGIEVRQHDKVSALSKVGQHLGMFAKTLKLGNEDDKPFETVIRWATEGEETRLDPSQVDSSADD